MENKKTCYLCNAFIEDRNNCPSCLHEYKKVKPKCYIDITKFSTIKEIQGFIQVSEEHFFEFEEYETIVLGNNAISKLIELLKNIKDDDQKEYEIMLGLRMCGVEIQGSLSECIRYTYRLPNEHSYSEII